MKYTGTHRGAGELRNTKMILLLTLTMLVATRKVCAQTQATGGETPSPVAVPDTGKTQFTEQTQKHRFWDRKNDLLFAGVGAARTFDYFSTLNLRRRGDNEILLTNAVVDNHAGFAAIEAAGTGVSIGTSYLFHHYRHHKLERWTSMVHFGLATTRAVRHYCLQTAHPRTTP